MQGARLPAAVSEIVDFAAVVLIVAGGLFVAVATSKVGTWFPIPGPAIFLIVAAVASDVFPGLSVVSIETASRIGIVALIVILFEGGMDVGWRRFRRAWPEITVLGVLGTFGTALLVALFAHTVLDLSWTLAAVLGAALAPTDPAVMFSVLGRKEIRGRTGTTLLGESGVNDPVAISLMIGALEFATNDDASFWGVAFEFVSEMAVGLALGVLGAIVLRESMRRIDLANETLYPILALAFAGVLYGVTTLAHGSGFLPSSWRGCSSGTSGRRTRARSSASTSHSASLAEIAVFAVLGLTISLGDFDGDRVAGRAAAGRPARVRRPAGRRGAADAADEVPLGRTPLRDVGRSQRRRADHARHARAARRHRRRRACLRHDLRRRRVLRARPGHEHPVRRSAARRPHARLRSRRHRQRVVAVGSSAAGRTLRDLPLGERTWVRAVTRDGRPCRLGGETVLEEGDEVELVLDVSDVDRLDDLCSARAVEDGEPAARQRADEAEQQTGHELEYRLRRRTD